MFPWLELHLCALILMAPTNSIVTANGDSRGNFRATPRSAVDPLRSILKHVSTIMPIVATAAYARQATALESTAVESPFARLPLGERAYSMVGDLTCCKILNGMWQVSGAHGFQPNKPDVVAKMAEYAGSFYSRLAF